MTLETFFDVNGIDEVAFAKVNIEGAEFPVILGSDRNVLRKVKLWTILYHEDMYHGKGADIANYLTSCGYTVAMRNVTAKRGWIIAERMD